MNAIGMLYISTWKYARYKIVDLSICIAFPISLLSYMSVQRWIRKDIKMATRGEIYQNIQKTGQRVVVSTIKRAWLHLAVLPKLASYRFSIINCETSTANDVSIVDFAGACKSIDTEKIAKNSTEVEKRKSTEKMGKTMKKLLTPIVAPTFRNEQSR